MSRLPIVAAFLFALIAGPTAAADKKPFDAATFAALQAADKPVLIDVRADWCPTCRQQAPIIASLLAAPEFAAYTVLEVNFDNQPAVLRQFKVTQQSTLIVYKGRNEVARSTGDTRKDGIAALLRKATG
ncbi:MAG: thioredoxin family protein [Casimicrobiaceae bacterium]